ncbi:flavin reductase family protein [Deinococcus enclensis]|uniref:Flavin reductase (DIM6/NTAB) family NADH-FMN oxidoreductase RutF n=1 Tax=Deinococcus enclensis TaxID=1049582 RepID=A0ABT9M905_9DEIO|nr:flavin reductase family protein [Deinococcus enclensis]MDP9763058.1 flavin reductase (DIM6/NTAB) family NADH-FMN oxidoreductase RutF [Deinococcus enclensis]
MLTESDLSAFLASPVPVVAVTARHAGVRNAMAAGWSMPLSMTPPLYGVQVGKERGTHLLITGSGEFGVNFLPLTRARTVHGAGSFHLYDGVDKYARVPLTEHPDAPLALAEAFLHYTCRVVNVVETGDHDLFVGEVVRVLRDPEFYDAQGVFRGSAALHNGRGLYVGSGQERLAFPKDRY